MTCDGITEALWIGSAPVGTLTRRSLHDQFDMLVLMAEEYQPRAESFPGLEVLHAGISDNGSPPTAAELQTAAWAAGEVAAAVRRGKRVLVTCMMGLNRSGLACALALRMLARCSGREAMHAVRASRTGAIFNPWFERVLEEMPALRGPGLARAPASARR
jgi:protein-tyrosine phosphatase